MSQGQGTGRKPYGYAPRFETEDMGGNNGVLKIKTYKLQDFGSMTRGSDLKAVITFEQFPSKEMVLNRTDYKILCKVFGEPSESGEEWIGKLVPIVQQKVTDPQSGETVVKPHVAPAPKWDAMLEAAAKAKADAQAKARAKASRND